MVESGEKKSQEPPTAEELAQAERYEAMMVEIARQEADDYDLEDDAFDEEEAELEELAKQHQLLAAVASQARKYHGLDFDDPEGDDDDD